MANSWGESGTTWGQGDWGQQNVTTFVIESGIFSSIGELFIFYYTFIYIT